MSNKKDLYKKDIMDLWRNPKNFGQLDDPSHEFHEANNLCGDEVQIHMKIEDGIIKDVKFFGTGCMVCIIFASEVTEKIKGMKEEDVLKMTQDDLLKLLDVNVSKAKMYCACLSLDAVKHCIEQGKIN